MERKLLNYKISKKLIRNNYYNGNVEFKQPNKILINSLINSELLCNALIDDNYKNIYFKCSSLCLLEDCYNILKTINIHKIIYDISRQMQYLLEKEEEKYVFIGFDPRHILVVNGNQFMYIDGCQLEKIDKEENILIKYPPKQYDFIIAPELYEITELPCKINYKCSYFSVGVLYLFIYKIIETKNGSKIDTVDREEIKYYLNQLSLNGTKIYYFLKRCLKINPIERKILFI